MRRHIPRGGFAAGLLLVALPAIAQSGPSADPLLDAVRKLRDEVSRTGTALEDCRRELDARDRELLGDTSSAARRRDIGRQALETQARCDALEQALQGQRAALDGRVRAMRLAAATAQPLAQPPVTASSDPTAGGSGAHHRGPRSLATTDERLQKLRQIARIDLGVDGGRRQTDQVAIDAQIESLAEFLEQAQALPDPKSTTSRSAVSLDTDKGNTKIYLKLIPFELHAPGALRELAITLSAPVAKNGSTSNVGEGLKNDLTVQVSRPLMRSSRQFGSGAWNLSYQWDFEYETSYKQFDYRTLDSLDVQRSGVLRPRKLETHLSWQAKRTGDTPFDAGVHRLSYASSRSADSLTLRTVCPPSGGTPVTCVRSIIGAPGLTPQRVIGYEYTLLTRNVGFRPRLSYDDLSHRKAYTLPLYIPLNKGFAGVTAGVRWDREFDGTKTVGIFLSSPLNWSLDGPSTKER